MNTALQKKYRYLDSLSEDEFREKVVRRLLFRLGFEDGRDLDGPDELGKDAVFFEVDPFGEKRYTFVQTKIGNINMSANASTNLENCIAQLRTALKTPFRCISTKKNVYPKEVLFCTSGRMNEKARVYVLESIRDERLTFKDQDDLIPLIDKHCPEIWVGLETDLFPYLVSMKRRFSASTSAIASRPGMENVAAIDFDQHIDLRLMKRELQTRKRKGERFESIETKVLTTTAFLEDLPRKAMIIGDAGCGKTELLKRITVSLGDQSIAQKKAELIPVFIEATSLVHCGADRLEIIAAQVAKSYGDFQKDAFSAADLEAGRVVILVDALDEVGEGSDLKKVFSLLAEFMSERPDCPLLVTSRQYDRVYRGLRELNLVEYEILPLEFIQAEKMLKKIEKKGTLAPQDSKEILRKLNSIHGIELNPLLISIFASTADLVRSDLPANITELFKKYTELMLGRWDETKGLSSQYQAPLKDRILSAFGYRLHKDRRTNFGFDELSEFVRDCLDDLGQSASAEKLIAELVPRSELFSKEGDLYRFRHHMLQEFFAGRGIPEHEDVQGFIDDDWWQNPIVFYYGENPNIAGSIIKIILESSTKPSWQSIRTIGLAIQACYLSRVDDRVDVWKYCVQELYPIFKERLEAAKGDRYPNLFFIGDYIFTRDSVALSVLSKQFEEVIAPWLSDPSSEEEELESRRLWTLVSLIETGKASDAAVLLERFPIQNEFYLLALHFGAYLASEVRLIEEKEKNSCDSIMRKLEPKVSLKRAEVIREFKGQALELRKGKIKAIDSD